MNYKEEIRDAAHTPKRLEQLYSDAKGKQEEDAFQAGLMACYEESSDNLLYAAWYYRLQQVTTEIEEQGRRELEISNSLEHNHWINLLGYL